MKSIYKFAIVLITGAVLLAEPALALIVTDGSDRGIPPNDLAKIMSIMAPLGGNLSNLRQAAGQGNERYYCGRVQMANNVEPFLVNIFADQKYVLHSDENAETALTAYGCL